MTKPTWVYAWAETSTDDEHNHIATVLNRLDDYGYDVYHMKQEGHTYDIVAKLRTEPVNNSPEQKEYFLRLAARCRGTPESRDGRGTGPQGYL